MNLKVIPSCAKIPLNNGGFAVVDIRHALKLAQFRWFRLPGRYTNYAFRRVRLEGGKYTTRFMHHDVLGHQRIDHANGNGLDNREGNLRVATRSQNACNSRKRQGCASQFKGVSWFSSAKKWGVQVGGKGRRYFGLFESEREAAALYNKIAARRFGKFAKLNPL